MNDILIVLLLFLVGLVVGTISIIIGLKGPLPRKEYLNKCDHCNHRFEFYELLPVIPFLLKGGRCSYCDKKSSFWYPFLEIVSGLLFGVSYLIYGFEYEMLVFIILTILTIMIFVSDFKYFIILDKPIWVFCIIILFAKWYTYGFKTFVESVCAGILIFIFMYSIRYFANMIFKRDSLGGGDIKLSTFFGVLVAIRLSIVSLCLGSFLAFPYAIYYSILDKKKEIPFGPFLIFCLFVVFVFMEPINTFIAIIFR